MRSPALVSPPNSTMASGLENITKFAIVDRFSGEAKISKMFWRGCGPRDPNTALACSVAHDKHNIWVAGSSDAAMAAAVNALVETQGGWALVRAGRLAATVRFGSCRSMITRR